MRNIPYIFWIFQLVNGVSGVEELQLMVGDSVTLKSAEIPSKETIQWLFGSTRIAEIKDGSGDPQYNEKLFKDELEMDKKTGSLTIKNINTYHSGNYIQNIAETDLINMTVKVTDKDNSRVVMVGDRVILKTGATGIERHQVLWTFGDDPYNPDDKRWNNTNLNNESEDLIIDKIKGSQFGIYTLKITTNSTILQRHFNVILSDGEESLFVMEGYYVPLFTNVINIKDYQIELKFNNQVINTSLNGAADSRWSNIHLNDQTGDLTIRNIKLGQFGKYEVKIKNNDNMILHRKFHIYFNDIKILPLMEGNHVTLYNSITVKTGDLILWLYGNESIPIAEVKIKVDKRSYGDLAFRDRLKLDLQTGSLTISNTRTSDSGLYMMKINSDRGEHKYTRYIVDVNVSDTSSWSLGFVFLGGVLVGAAVLAFLWLYCKKSKGQ